MLERYSRDEFLRVQRQIILEISAVTKILISFKAFTRNF